MQIAAEIRRANAKEPQKVLLSDFKLEFNTGPKKPSHIPIYRDDGSEIIVTKELMIQVHKKIAIATAMKGNGRASNTR